MYTHPTWLLANCKLKCLSPYFEALACQREQEEGPCLDSVFYLFTPSHSWAWLSTGRALLWDALQLCSRHVFNGLCGLLMKKTAFCKFSVWQSYEGIPWLLGLFIVIKNRASAVIALHLSVQMLFTIRDGKNALFALDAVILSRDNKPSRFLRCHVHPHIALLSKKSGISQLPAQGSLTSKASPKALLAVFIEDRTCKEVGLSWCPYCSSAPAFVAGKCTAFMVIYHPCWWLSLSTWVWAALGPVTLKSNRDSLGTGWQDHVGSSSPHGGSENRVQNEGPVEYSVTSP